jgi:hypothetical protein
MCLRGAGKRTDLALVLTLAHTPSAKNLISTTVKNNQRNKKKSVLW